LPENRVNISAMLKKYISDLIIEEIKFSPTDCQREMAEKVALFITSNHPNIVFLLRGYAGTGKTTVLSALVHVLDTLKTKTVLLAPTGRASKTGNNHSQTNLSATIKYGWLREIRIRQKSALEYYFHC